MILTAGVTPRSLRIRSFSGPYFPTVRIQSEFRKIRTRKTLNTDTSHTMSFGYLITHLNPFQPSAAFTIKTSHLLCSATRMTSFYMKRNIRLKWFKHYAIVPSSLCIIRISSFMYLVGKWHQEPQKVYSKNYFVLSISNELCERMLDSQLKSSGNVIEIDYLLWMAFNRINLTSALAPKVYLTLQIIKQKR